MKQGRETWLLSCSGGRCLGRQGSVRCGGQISFQAYRKNHLIILHNQVIWTTKEKHIFCQLSKLRIWSECEGRWPEHSSHYQQVWLLKMITRCCELCACTPYWWARSIEASMQRKHHVWEQLTEHRALRHTGCPGSELASESRAMAESD